MQLCFMFHQRILPGRQIIALITLKAIVPVLTFDVIFEIFTAAKVLITILTGDALHHVLCSFVRSQIVNTSETAGTQITVVAYALVLALSVIFQKSLLGCLIFALFAWKHHTLVLLFLVPLQNIVLCAHKTTLVAGKPDTAMFDLKTINLI